MHLFQRTLIPLATLALASPLAQAASPAACKPGLAIHECGYVKIGGIEQWISIDGADCAKPALLLVDGGPGNPISVDDKGPYAAWNKDYVVIHWDQRASGLTWTRNAPSEDTPSITSFQIQGIAPGRSRIAVMFRQGASDLGTIAFDTTVVTAAAQPAKPLAPAIAPASSKTRGA